MTGEADDPYAGDFRGDLPIEVRLYGERIELKPGAECLGYVCCDRSGVHLLFYANPKPEFGWGPENQVVARVSPLPHEKIQPGTQLVLAYEGTPVVHLTVGDKPLPDYKEIHPILNPVLNFFTPPFKNAAPNALFCLGVYLRADTATTYPST